MALGGPQAPAPAGSRSPSSSLLPPPAGSRSPSPAWRGLAAAHGEAGRGGLRRRPWRGGLGESRRPWQGGAGSAGQLGPLLQGRDGRAGHGARRRPLDLGAVEQGPSPRRGLGPRAAPPRTSSLLLPRGAPLLVGASSTRARAAVAGPLGGLDESGRHRLLPPPSGRGGGARAPPAAAGLELVRGRSRGGGARARAAESREQSAALAVAAQTALLPPPPLFSLLPPPSPAWGHGRPRGETAATSAHGARRPRRSAAAASARATIPAPPWPPAALARRGSCLPSSQSPRRHGTASNSARQSRLLPSQLSFPAAPPTEACPGPIHPSALIQDGIPSLFPIPSWRPLRVPGAAVPAAGSWRRCAPRVPVAGSCRHRAPLRARDTRASCGLRPLA
ncbi:hypothetical protein PVAP13_2NG595440 [Panicum virgatum]|uniref:Uncharacterized protein n=1 Tax=Panicum virgatum TaxID=38727 RepID=A0A8T0VNP5_PANVG|nr:hypothetical protein PVAP13_2NG595440 [Panicum virgatum]